MTLNRQIGLAAAALGLVALLATAPASAQVFQISKQELIDYTAENPFGRFDDGRPKVPDEYMERAKGMSAEDVWTIMSRKNYNNQYADGFMVLHPNKKLIGRAFTAQFMPFREDVDKVAQAKAKAAGLSSLRNQTVIDMLQPGDVLVVDLFGKKEGGTIVGDNLFYYIYKTTKTGGVVIDGSVRDLEGLSEIDMAAYFRNVHPTPISSVMLTGINVPVRIGGTTVMPGDMVFGDKEGIYFIPPQMVKEVCDNADEIHVHDEWTKKKFDEGKYKSSDIYGSPKDPELKKEYADYLKKRLAEIRKARQK
ncbi:MAG: dimethylmenaquinone methyltransferase [Bryobacteraceae bacterium]